MLRRTEVLPQLTDNNDPLVLAHATVPSYLRYGATPTIVVFASTRQRCGRAPLRRPVHRRRRQRQRAGHPAGRRPGARRLALIIATSLSMVFGELVPKNIAVAEPLPTARTVAGPQLLVSA
ncbi:CNNM domain-containing protein, partial [Mycolicibacterium insubricum]|uniref:CNNM domain-containing protein n=1 Tax=Mycolicibacterium insubricum TaxID=444597 RepID=UPI0021F39CE4